MDTTPILSLAAVLCPNCQTSHISRAGMVNMLPIRVISATAVIAKAMSVGFTEPTSEGFNEERNRQECPE